MQVNHPGKIFKHSEDKKRIQNEPDEPKQWFNKMKICKDKDRNVYV